MNGGYEALTYGDVAIAGTLVLVAGIVSLGMGLRLERRLAIASVRTVLQLLLVGYILRWVFALDNPLAVALIMILMIAAATQAALTRPARTYPGAAPRVFFGLVLSGIVTCLVVTQVVIGVEPWYNPQYLIPLLGMILGNSLNGISLALDQVLGQFWDKRALVETELAHGATRWEAAHDIVSDAVRLGMIPIINSMSIVGLVSLPGMMTGQILAGMDPLEAVKYQIVVMFMIAAATSIGCILVVMLTYYRLFNDHHQMRAERIKKR